MPKNDESRKPSQSKRIFDKIKESSKDLLEGIKEEVEAGASSSSEKAHDYAKTKSEGLKTSIKQRAADTSTPEDIYYSTWAWFWMMIIGIFFALSILIFSLINIKFLLLGLLILLALPFFIIWCIIHMIPTIRIFGFTVFDRKQLSLKRQLSVGKEIARLFSREFLQESPLIAFFIIIFVFVFLISILSALLTG